MEQKETSWVAEVCTPNLFSPGFARQVKRICNTDIRRVAVRQTGVSRHQVGPIQGIKEVLDLSTKGNGNIVFSVYAKVPMNEFNMSDL